MEKILKKILEEQQKQTKILKSIEGRLKDNDVVPIDREEFANSIRRCQRRFLKESRE